MNKIYVKVYNIDETFVMSNYNQLLQNVYEERREAVERLRFDAPKIRSLAAGSLLQNVLIKECGFKKDDIGFRYGKNGKPFLDADKGVYFNLSHSGTYVVVAYGNTDIGVDIERTKESDRDVLHNARIASKYFSKEEADYIFGKDADRIESNCDAERFCHIWTMKESYLKLTGSGISVTLNSFTADAVNSLISDTDICCYTVDIPGYKMTVSTSGFSEVIIDEVENSYILL